MTQYSRIHVYGQGPNFSDIANQDARAERKTKWANENPDKLIGPDQLYEAMAELEKNPPQTKAFRRRKRKAIDANVPTRRHRKGRGKRRGKK